MSGKKRAGKPSALPQDFTPPPSGPASWKSRIVKHGTESPENLLANPANHRIHSMEQQSAMEAVLNTVGWVGDVIVNQRTGHMIDGHMRVRLALRRDEPTVPVTYVDLSLAEEKVILATYDKLGSMATLDGDKVRELVGDVRSVVAGIPSLDALIESLIPGGHSVTGDQAPAAGHLAFGGVEARFDPTDWIIWGPDNLPLVTVKADGVVVIKPRISRNELQIIFRDVARRMKELEAKAAEPAKAKK